MEPVIEIGGARVFHGDCRDVLRSLPDNSVDSIVTDPPYELGFMGKKWDNSGIAYDVTVWAECLRVLKPGGHILAFGGSRTWHRLAVAVEDAGFEIRDNIAWIYGSGFPKSLDVSKAIDKGQGVNRDRQLQFTAWMRSTGITAEQINEATGTAMASHYLTEKSQPAIATADLFDKLRPYLPAVPEAIERLVAERTGIEWTAYKQREVIGQSSNGIAGGTGKHAGEEKAYGFAKDFAITNAATSEAKTWEGWGTALKPAHEPVVVGRKPLTGTVAENVLAWGVGGLNIDGSRIGTAVETWPSSRNYSSAEMSRPGSTNASDAETQKTGPAPAGRWPANVIFDEVTAGLLDEQVGTLTSGANPKSRGNDSSRAVYGDFRGQNNVIPARGIDSGGASRFFYVAKASKRDRNEGLEELEAVSAGDMVDRVEGSAGMDSPRAGAGRTSGAKNFHPTVKPTQLMRYLIKLVTPPGGTVLDPFTGSGSTGKAALLDGFQFVGVELTAEYLPIIEGRLRWATEQGDDDVTLF